MNSLLPSSTNELLTGKLPVTSAVTQHFQKRDPGPACPRFAILHKEEGAGWRGLVFCFVLGVFCCWLGFFWGFGVFLLF